MANSSVIIQNLIERLQNGDETAREDLIVSAQQRLDQLTRKMFNRFSRVRRWEDVSDVRQNSSLRLWRALHDVTPANAADFFRLAATQIRRELIDMARQHFGPEGVGKNHSSGVRKSDSDSVNPMFPDAIAQEADAHELAEWTEFHDQVDRLPDDERAAYDLLWYQELTREEAARILNMSVWTLRRHYRNAKLRLHKWLGRQDS